MMNRKIIKQWSMTYDALARVAEAIRRDSSFPGAVYDAYDPETATMALTVDGVAYWLQLKPQVEEDK
jgi:hypothetical protein